MKSASFLYPECRLPDEFPADGYSAGIVKRMGYTEVSREEDADVVIYNTCTVRENANLKIYGHLGHLKSIKKRILN